jgi:murein DD-endopeptidase MepM/ murein hydrolase activator NlpD
VPAAGGPIRKFDGAGAVPVQWPAMWWGFLIWSTLNLTAPADSGPQVSLVPAQPRQGQVVRVEVSGIGLADRVAGELFGRPLYFYRDSAGRVRALAAVPLDAEPGSHPVLIKVTPLLDDAVFSGRPLIVVAGDFPVQRLRVARRYVTPPPELKRRLRRERAELDLVQHAPPAPRLWRGDFSWPRRDRITSDFGLQRVFNGQPKGRHLGLDIDGQRGDPVRALGAGRVVLVAHRYFCGRTVVVDHGRGLHSTYCHLADYAVAEGERVERGQRLGGVGASGRVTGSHLHLAVDVQGRPVDPLSLFDLPLAEPGAAEPPAPAAIAMDRDWDVLDPERGDGSERALLEQAGRALGAWRLVLARSAFDGDDLRAVAAAPAEEPLLRALRERLGIPVVLADLLYFIDDVLQAGRWGLRGERVWVTSSRARRAGILVRPDEVFDGVEPRRYGARGGRLHIYRPSGGAGIRPAADGAPPCANWIGRYPNPRGRPAKLAALRRRNPVFADRIRSLIGQLEAQGADVVLFSTVRDPRRGYLMWGAFELARARSRRAVRRWVAELDRLNRQWAMHVPIRWQHPDGWRATVRAADRMANAYDVVYATRHGARSSSHYDAEAADLTAWDLPRRLRLVAPDGTRRVFDLSAPHHPRDLSLEPELIAWIETHFGLEKLRADYPHWSDNRLPLVPLRLADSG